jgi:hypothetical protein
VTWQYDACTVFANVNVATDPLLTNRTASLKVRIARSFGDPVLLEKSAIACLVKKYPAFYETRNLIH